MWHLSVSAWELVLRSAVVFAVLLLLLRASGKRQVAQLTPFDLILFLIISNGVQNAINAGDNSLLGGIIIATTLIILNYLMGLATYHSRKLEDLLEGRPEILISNGKLYPDVMRREKITRQELDSALRNAGCESPEQVHLAVLENTGHVSVIPKAK